jgi:hypothetical protein
LVYHSIPSAWAGKRARSCGDGEPQPDDHKTAARDVNDDEVRIKDTPAGRWVLFIAEENKHNEPCSEADEAAQAKPYAGAEMKPFAHHGMWPK